jgi:hypothetical protein
MGKSEMDLGFDPPAFLREVASMIIKLIQTAANRDALCFNKRKTTQNDFFKDELLVNRRSFAKSPVIQR